MYKSFVSLKKLNYDRAINDETKILEGLDGPLEKGTVFTTVAPFEGTLPDSEERREHFGRFWTVEFNQLGKTYTMTINGRDLKNNDDLTGIEPAKFRGEMEGGRKKRRRTGRRNKSSRRKSRRNKK